MLMLLIFLWTYDRKSAMDVSVSAGDLLQLDGTLDGSVLIGEEFQQLTPRAKRYIHVDPCYTHLMTSHDRFVSFFDVEFPGVVKNFEFRLFAIL